MGATSFQRMRRQQALKERVGDDKALRILQANNVEEINRLERLDVKTLEFPNDMKDADKKAIVKAIKSAQKGTETKEETNEFDLSEANNAEVEAYVAEIDDVETLEDMLVEEANGKDRKGATEAITSRIEELQSETETEDEETPSEDSDKEE